MEGSHEREEDRGMIPRAVEQIFEYAEKLKELGWKYEFEAFFLEIYNESIRDLLASKELSDVAYKITHVSDQETEVSNITTVKVAHAGQVHKLLEKAARHRSVSKTEMNARSSRSHSVFTLRISGHNSITSAKTKGVLNLIDLAGSERVNASGVTGERLTETKNINKSLACLGDVISALANGDKFIPYRNSKLTYLLQNSLGGNSKTLMFVNVSPRVEDLPETLSSLRFATKVNACEIGTAKKGGRVDLNSEKSEK